MRRTTLRALLAMIGLVVLTACSVSSSLRPTLPEEDGRFTVEQKVSQPFYAESDGLHKLTIRFSPQGTSGSQMPLDPSRGAVIEVNYSPDEDPRFPEPSFHSWPEDQEWLPELTRDVRYEQTFCSPYPDLSGIEVRVATFWGDLTPGTGILVPYETVEVLDRPIDGNHVGFLPGESEVEVLGSTEGWVRVLLADDERGWVDMEHFDELPEPGRVNDEDVILELFEEGRDEPLRRSAVNAGDMFDISHVPFEFEPVSDSLDSCYRFAFTSPESEPGNAITLRYDPDGPYPEGQAILNGEPTDGDIVFQPKYDFQESLYLASLDEYEWAAPLDAFEARFDPIPDTADRYLEVAVHAGDTPVNVPWSRIRPPGQRPLQAEGVPDAPGGGLVFNASFRDEIPFVEIARVSARDVLSSARIDTLFFFGLTALLAVTVIGGAFAWRRRDVDGR